MLPSTKATLRTNALKRRDQVDPDSRARFARRLADLLPRLRADLLQIGGDHVTALYAPIGSEPDCLPLAVALHEAGVSLALPVDASPGDALVYRAWIPGDRLAAGPLGIGEPLDSAPVVRPDVIFMPVVAFDRRGHRIGYGAGNVDRTLRARRARGPIMAIGLAYAVQEELYIPDEPQDETLDLVVTERETIVFQR